MANDLNTITVDGVTYKTSDYSAALNAVTDKTAGGKLDKDAFLQLLCKQLEYQDPLDPQDNSQYIAQLANFSSLEQMTNIASGLTSVANLVSNIDTSVLVGQLSNMIGKEIQWTSTTNSPDGKPVTASLAGKVTGVSISDGAPTIIAQDANKNIYQVPVDKLTRVGTVDTEKA